MKRHIIISVFLIFSVAAIAQTDRTLTRSNSVVRFAPGSALLQTDPATGMSFQTAGSPFITTPAGIVQSDYKDNYQDESTSSTSSNIGYTQNLSTNKKDSTAKGELHGSVGLSVMAGFGKGAPKGAGFAQDINLDYTTPLGKRGWLTVGGYMDHLNWSGMNSTSAGLYGELGYQFDDHWSAYIYGQKSLANSGYGYGYPYYGGYYGGYYGYGYNGYYGYGYPGGYWNADRLGAAVRWTPSKNFMLQISVEKDWLPRQDNFYSRRYDYQR